MPRMDRDERRARRVEALMLIAAAANGAPLSSVTPERVQKVVKAAEGAMRPHRPRYVVDNRPKSLIERFEDGADRLFGLK